MRVSSLRIKELESYSSFEGTLRVLREGVAPCKMLGVHDKNHYINCSPGSLYPWEEHQWVPSDCLSIGHLGVYEVVRSSGGNNRRPGPRTDISRSYVGMDALEFGGS